MTFADALPMILAAAERHKARQDKEKLITPRLVAAFNEALRVRREALAQQLEREFWEAERGGE